MCWDAVFLRFGAGGTLIVPATPEKRSAEITTFFFCDLVKALWFVTTKALITPSLATVCAVAKPTPGPLSSTLCCSATERKNQRLMPALREAEPPRRRAAALPRNRHFPLPTSVCVCVGRGRGGGDEGAVTPSPAPSPGGARQCPPPPIRGGGGWVTWRGGRPMRKGGCRQAGIQTAGGRGACGRWLPRGRRCPARPHHPPTPPLTPRMSARLVGPGPYRATRLVSGRPPGSAAGSGGSPSPPRGVWGSPGSGREEI